MKSKTSFTKRDVFIILGCIVFLLASLGAIGSTGRRRAKEAVCVLNLQQWGRIWKSYTDDHDGYFPSRGGGDPFEDTVSGWPGATQVYYENPKLLFCPAATRSWIDGATYPFAAWTAWSEDVRVDSSYCVNYWVARELGVSKFWGTPYVANAAYVPVMCDGNWKDTQPYETDEPFQTREQMVREGWTPNTHEMRRVCIDRHGAYVNACFLDLSARRIGLKQLWRTRWHKQWDMQASLPNPAWPGGKWPEWMQNFEDPE